MRHFQIPRRWMQIQKPSDWLRKLGKLFVGAIIGACLCTLAHAQDGEVYVTGEDATVYDVFHLALANKIQRTTRPFWIIVTGYDAKWLTKSVVGQSIPDWISRIRERHGNIYVCEPDMKFYGIDQRDLLEGVRSIPDETAKVRPPRDLMLPGDKLLAQRMVEICADRHNEETQSMHLTAYEPAREIRHSRTKIGLLSNAVFTFPTQKVIDSLRLPRSRPAQPNYVY